MNGLVSNFDALDSSEPYEVCIIGCGFAGSVLAAQLVERGLRTLVLESGGGLRHWLFDKRVKELAAYEFSGDTDYPLTRTSGRLVGGNSNFWTGRAERFQPSDFEPHAYTAEDNPWPIRYDELTPYYQRAEETLRVRGGPFSNHMPPREEPLPLPGKPDISSLKKLYKPVGVVVDDSPTATPKKGWRFFRTPKEILPPFKASPIGELVTGVTCTRLIHDENDRITGAEVKTLDGQSKVARARAFVVLCGGIQTPRLLLLSHSDRFPDGIGNLYDRVGRGFNEHAGVNIYAKIKHNKYTLDPTHKVGRTHQFYEMYRGEGLGAIHPVLIQSFVFPHHLVNYTLGDTPKHLLKMLSRVVMATVYTGCQIEMRPNDENRITLSETRNDPLGQPLAHLTFNYSEDDKLLLDRVRKLLHGWLDKLNAEHRDEIPVTWARHHVGTCRMGDDPQTSVCDANLRVHDCQNLYLGGCETYPTGTGLPPSLTMIALIHRLGDHLIDQFDQGAYSGE
jgi:choline dehydrogenase-like flavoprotein